MWLVSATYQSPKLPSQATRWSIYHSGEIKPSAYPPPFVIEGRADEISAGYDDYLQYVHHSDYEVG